MEKDPTHTRHIEDGDDAPDHKYDLAPTNTKLMDTTYHDEEASTRTRKSAAEKRLLRKTDMVIVPLCCLMYFTAYLDRNSIGLANVMGLSKNLHLSPNQYYNCLTMFFVGYIVFMLPGNIFVRVVPPPYLIGGAALCYGGFLVGMSAAQNYATVLSLRILIGAAQAFTQGLGVYFTMWYQRDEVATRSAIYYAAASISGAFSGLIAYGIEKDLTLKATGKEPWRWLFIIEGSLAMFVGVLLITLLPKLPDRLIGKKHWLFNSEEIALAVKRMRVYNTVGAKVNLRQILDVAKDPKCWLFASINAGTGLGVGSVGLFLPTFVKEFGYSTEKTLLFTVIPYAVGGVLLPIVSLLADRINRKGPFVIGGLMVPSIGYIILLTVQSNSVKIFATCLITAGVYTCAILVLTWLGINMGGFTKRAVTWALAEIFAQCFSIMGTHIYDGPPRFIKGHAIVLGFLVWGIIAATILIIMMSRENRRKDAELQEYRDRGEVHPDVSKSLEEMQDKHILFRYIL